MFCVLLFLMVYLLLGLVCLASFVSFMIWLVICASLVCSYALFVRLVVRFCGNFLSLLIVFGFGSLFVCVDCFSFGCFLRVLLLGEIMVI